MNEMSEGIVCVVHIVRFVVMHHDKSVANLKFLLIIHPKFLIELRLDFFPDFDKNIIERCSVCLLDEKGWGEGGGRGEWDISSFEGDLDCHIFKCFPCL